eukprot:scpid84372/ scgid26074/ 
MTGITKQQRQQHDHLCSLGFPEGRTDSSQVGSGDHTAAFQRFMLWTKYKYVVFSMLSALHHQSLPRATIQFVFPVRAHSFLPADCIFGRIEKKLRQLDTILEPSGCYDVLLRQFGTHHCYGNGWTSLDFKAASKGSCEQTRSFKISAAKHLAVENNGIGFQSSYAGEVCQHTILKRGHSWAGFLPKDLPMVSPVKPAKRSDTFKLLKEDRATDTVKQAYEDLLATTTAADKSMSSDRAEVSHAHPVSHRLYRSNQLSMGHANFSPLLI